jgi:cytoskeletal protein RodZ
VEYPKYIVARDEEIMIDRELTVGQNLQRKREEKNIPLQHVAEVTRITLSNLEALEKDEFYRLPAEFFARGFLRNYAKVVELDPEEVIAAYRCQTEANKKYLLAEASAPPAPPSFLKNVRNHLFDWVSTILGASPSFSIDKYILPPRD